MTDLVGSLALADGLVPTAPLSSEDCERLPVVGGRRRRLHRFPEGRQPGGVRHLDLTQDLALLSGLGETIASTLNSALGLSGLLDIDLLKITEEVAPDGDYSKALSSLTAIGVTVNPLVGALQTGSGELTATDVLGGTGLTGGGMGLLGGLLGGVTSVLSEGAGINVGTMASEGAFSPVAALRPTIVDPPKVTTPDDKLPRTGADTALPAAMAMLLAGAALGVRRLARNEQR